MQFPAGFTRLAVRAFLLILVLGFLHRPLIGGDAFLPADQLALLSPWRATVTADSPDGETNTTPWNVLRFDGITQFYPWRLEAARAYQAGRIPLWNPYTFAADGGTPLLANSQSAPLYPLNILFFAAPLSLLWYSFGLSSAVHLLIAAGGMYGFLRSLSLRRAACGMGAVTYVLCGPIVTWLSLPTFLAVSAWLPLLLLLIRTAHTAADLHNRRLAVIGAGSIAGMVLLAGHLQIAFYVLLAGSLYALWNGAGEVRAGRRNLRFWIGAVAGAGSLALLLALPQLLPAVELSRVSSRAAQGKPSLEGYRGYVANAVPARHFAATLIPDFFGNPNDKGTLYWTTNNYAEWAIYVGIVPLLLALFALALPWRSAQGVLRERGFFALIGVLALALAFGTPVNLLFFFLIPGYSQTGNPGRCLFLFAFAISALAAIGLHSLADDTPVVAVKRRAALIAAVVPVFVGGIGASLSATFAAQDFPQVPFGALLNQAMPGTVKAVILLLSGAAALLITPRLTADRRPLALGVILLLTAADLFTFGYGYNPTTPHEKVYPVTPGIAFLQKNAKEALIAPLNTRWSISAAAPKKAVLPPNALTVYQLHDVQGYDSLFPAASREHVKAAMGGKDPAPPENGNIVFVKSSGAAIALGARYLILPPATDRPDLGIPVYSGSDMVIYENTAGKRFEETTQKSYAPASFRVGLFFGLCAVAAALTAAIGGSVRRQTAD